MGLGRVFGFLSLLATLGVGMYFYSLQVQSMKPAAGEGNTAEAAVIAGVKTDLIGIANAERGYMASQGKYASLEELSSEHYLTVKGERAPYVYEVAVASGSFRVTATRTTKGSPAELWIGDDMEIQTWK